MHVLVAEGRSLAQGRTVNWWQALWHLGPLLGPLVVFLPLLCLYLVWEGCGKRPDTDFSSSLLHQLKSLQRASLKRTPHGRRKVLEKRSRSPRRSGRRAKRRRRRLPALLRRSWMNVSRRWLPSRRPRIPLPVCLRAPLCWMNLSASTPTRIRSPWPCCTFEITLIKMAGPCGTLSIASLKSSPRPS